jgi:carbon-monoxide dehydrogenase medium subunit
LAGGQCLLTQMKLRQATPSVVVDLKKIPDLRGVRRQQSDGSLEIGAMVTCDEIARLDGVGECHLALVEAAGGVGDHQVRNRSTIGGNLACLEYPCDLPAVALALEAKVGIVGPGGRRLAPVEHLLGSGSGSHGRVAGEIILSVQLPGRSSGCGSAYEKAGQRASTYPLCGVAAVVWRAPDGTVERCRLGLAGASVQPVRLTKTEAALQGKPPSPENIVAAAKHVRNEGLSYISDIHASADYRAHLAEALTERALARASTRAGHP